MSDDNLIHLEVRRSWWDGSSTTACGLRVGKPEAVWTWFTDLKWCPTCKAADKARRKRPRTTFPTPTTRTPPRGAWS